MAQVGAVTALDGAIRRIVVDLHELGRHFALIGGLAVSVAICSRLKRLLATISADLRIMWIYEP